MIQHKIRQVHYDSVGVGTGYKVGVNNLQKTGAWPRSIEVHPWSGGDSVLDPDKNVIAGDKESPRNEDHFLNLKAQAWFMLRTRFYKTFRAVRYGETYDHKDLISLDSKMPRIHELKSELSQAVHKASANGKTMVDKKPDGARSPNLADAVVICYCGKGVRNSLFSFQG
jgi:phage terminase large subunit